MNELAIKASNDTMTADDRDYIDSEVQQLKEEINRVATTTTFNEQNLLDGTFTGKELQVGAENDAQQRIEISIKGVNTTTIGVDGVAVNGADATSARNSITMIKAALKSVSEQRSKLGAVQNRLEHTISNLNNVVENTTSAESAIRDTDMATEMVRFANNNILAQAGTSMLTQANQANQTVLSLLQ